LKAKYDAVQAEKQRLQDEIQALKAKSAASIGQQQAGNHAWQHEGSQSMTFGLVHVLLVMALCLALGHFLGGGACSGVAATARAL